MMSKDHPDPYSVEADAQPSAHAGAGYRDPFFDAIEQRGVYIITMLRGELVDTKDIEQCGDELRQFVTKKKAKKIVLDFHGVRFLSSSALGMLLSIKATMDGLGGQLRLARVREDLQKVFKLTKLHKVLPMKDSVDAATASL